MAPFPTDAQAQEVMVAWDALGRTRLPAPPVEVVPDLEYLFGPLPQAAYRLLLDFLRCDRGWCHYVTPVFSPGGWVSVYLNGAERRGSCREEIEEKEAGQDDRRPRAAGRREFGQQQGGQLAVLWDKSAALFKLSPADLDYILSYNTY